MLCLCGFELYSRWVPLIPASCQKFTLYILKRVSACKGSSIQISLEGLGEVNSGGYIHGDAKRQGIYLALFTDPECDSCFSICHISWIIENVTL